MTRGTRLFVLSNVSQAGLEPAAAAAAALVAADPKFSQWNMLLGSFP
jgi:hypothetical protein